MQFPMENIVLDGKTNTSGSYSFCPFKTQKGVCH